MAKKKPSFELQIPIVRADSRFDNITALWLRMTNQSWPLTSPRFHHSSEYHITVKGKPALLKPQSDDPRIALANYEHLRTRLAELISLVTKKTQPSSEVLAEMVSHAMEPAEVEDGPNELERLRREAVKSLLPHMAVFFTSLGLAKDQPPKPRNDQPTTTDIENVRKVMDGMGTRNPAVDKVREAVKAKGYRMSATKIGKAVKVIRGK